MLRKIVVVAVEWADFGSENKSKPSLTLRSFQENIHRNCSQAEFSCAAN